MRARQKKKRSVKNANTPKKGKPPDVISGDTFLEGTKKRLQKTIEIFEKDILSLLKKNKFDEAIKLREAKTLFEQRIEGMRMGEIIKKRRFQEAIAEVRQEKRLLKVLLKNYQSDPFIAQYASERGQYLLGMTDVLKEYISHSKEFF